MLCSASISGSILIFNIEEYILISNTGIFCIEAPRNEKWQVTGICEPPDIEESSILNAFSSISNWFNVEDSSILAFKTYTNIEALCFNIKGASILILAGPACAGLQQLQAAVQLRWYSVLIAVRISLVPGEAAQRRCKVMMTSSNKNFNIGCDIGYDVGYNL
jgi:hypothetical protein